MAEHAEEWFVLWRDLEVDQALFSNTSDEGGKENTEVRKELV